MEIRDAGAVTSLGKELTLWEKLQRTVASVTETVGSKIRNFGETAVDKVQAASQAVKNVADQVAASAKDNAARAATAVRNSTAAVVGGIKSTANWIKFAVPLGAAAVGLMALAKLKG